MAIPVKKFNRFLAGFFAMLASGSLAGCGMYGPPPASAMYGPPPREYYSINGKVLQEDGQGIPNIKVTLTETGDILHTDQDGSFVIENQNLLNYSSITIELEDIDGEENGGEFSPKSANINGFVNKEIKIEMELKNEN